MPPRAREHHVPANGLTHHLLEWGDPDASQTLVMCHGYLDQAYGFAELGPAVAAHGYRVLAPDFRGHGETGRAPEGSYYYFPDYVMDLHLLLPLLVDGPFHLLGHSMGGTVCALFAATHPKLLRSLTLIEGLGPVGEPPERAVSRMASWLEQGPRARDHHAQLRDLDEAYTRLARRHAGVNEAFLRALAERSTCPHPDGQGLTWRFDPMHRTLSPIAFEPARFLHMLRAIDAPTLVLAGQHGFRAPVYDERIAAVANVESREIAGAGHMVHWTHCAQVVSALVPHLQTR